MLVQLLKDCTSQEINYGICIKQKQYLEMESLSRIFCYDMYVRIRSSGVTSNSDKQCYFYFFRYGPPFFYVGALLRITTG
jgi:hypothetical protein